MTPLLTVRQAAERLNTSCKTVLKLIHSGSLAHVKWEGAKEYRIRPEEIARFIEASDSGTAAGAFHCPPSGEIGLNRAPAIRRQRPRRRVESVMHITQTKGVAG